MKTLQLLNLLNYIIEIAYNIELCDETRFFNIFCQHPVVFNNTLVLCRFSEIRENNRWEITESEYRYNYEKSFQSSKRIKT